MLTVTLYLTNAQAVRKTADDCRRMKQLMDTLAVVYDIVLVDTKEMRSFVEGFSGRNAIPLCCVGEVAIGTYDELADFNEGGELPLKLREAGYTESIRGGELIAVGAKVVSKKTVVKKVVVVKKKKEGNADDGAEKAEEGDAPHHSGTIDDATVNSAERAPPPDDDELPPPPPDDDEPPPPPPDDEMPPPPPPDDDDPPPPPPDDDPPPPPPPDE